MRGISKKVPLKLKGITPEYKVDDNTSLRAMLSK